MKPKSTVILFILVFKYNINTLFSQNKDTLAAAKEKAIQNEYFKNQQIVTLQQNDTPSDTKKEKQAINLSNEKLKFIILCFNLSQSYEDEISSLNKIVKEYEKQLSSFVINGEDLGKYKEIFTRKEFKSLQDFITNKSESQKHAISFPVILILDKNGQVLSAWSGDKTENGLKREDYYYKIKSNIDSMFKQ